MRELTSADRPPSGTIRLGARICRHILRSGGSFRQSSFSRGDLRSPFSSERPLSMDEIIARIGISKGSASQGLRQLEELGVVSRARERASGAISTSRESSSNRCWPAFSRSVWRLASHLAPAACNALKSCSPRCLRIFARLLAFACKESQSGTSAPTLPASGAKAVTGRLNPFRPCGKTTTYRMPEWSPETERPRAVASSRNEALIPRDRHSHLPISKVPASQSSCPSTTRNRRWARSSRRCSGSRSWPS